MTKRLNHLGILLFIGHIVYFLFSGFCIWLFLNYVLIFTLGIFRRGQPQKQNGLSAVFSPMCFYWDLMTKKNYWDSSPIARKRAQASRHQPVLLQNTVLEESVTFWKWIWCILELIAWIIPDNHLLYNTIRCPPLNRLNSRPTELATQTQYTEPIVSICDRPRPPAAAGWPIRTRTVFLIAWVSQVYSRPSQLR